MTHRIISTPVAPAAIGPYVQATAHGLPMAPRARFLGDPVQTLLHALAHFIVQPRRGGRGAALPALGRNRVDGGGQKIGHAISKKQAQRGARSILI